MKKATLVAIIAISAFACKKSTSPAEAPAVKYYFKIEAVDTDGTQSTITTYKMVTVK